jgi:hypothetical protein
MQYLFYALVLSAVGVMAAAVVLVLRLRARIPGGAVRSTWNVLTGLILVFMAGYLSTPFFPLLPQVAKDLLVGVIFLAGAIFVVAVIKLFHRITVELGL